MGTSSSCCTGRGDSSVDFPRLYNSEWRPGYKLPNLSPDEELWMAALAEICDSRTPAPSDELHLPAELVPKRLYLGGVEAAKDLPALAALGVATVVNCAPDTCARLTGERYYDGLDALPGRGAVRYVEVGASDWMGYPLLERHTVEICEAIGGAEGAGAGGAGEDEGDGRRGAAFVHCFAGQNRSAALCVAWLIIEGKMHLLDAVRLVHGKRPVVLTNISFRLQLVHLAVSLGQRVVKTPYPWTSSFMDGGERGGGGNSNSITTTTTTTTTKAVVGGHDAPLPPLPWAFAPLPLATLGRQLQSAIPDTFLWVHPTRQSGKVALDRLHVSVLLKLARPRNEVTRLRDVIAPRPLRLRVASVFVSHVERLMPEDVWCIGLEFASPDMRALKDRWMNEMYPGGLAEKERRRHDPYGREGHCSLVYIRGEHRAEAEGIVAGLRGEVEGTELVLETIVVEARGDGYRETVVLAGSVAVA
jgi:hypothetical protein